MPKLSTRTLDIAILAAISLVLAGLLDITWFRLYFAHPGKDQSWLLYAAGRMLHGTALYGSQLYETNPPLIVWLSAIPIAVAAWLHINALECLRIFISVAILLSTLWCLRILRLARLARDLVLTSLWALALLAIEVSQHGNDFGQKDHILVLLLLPLLFFEAVSHDVHLLLTERVCLGICAGLSVSLKPHDGAILVCFELLLLVYTQNLRRLIRPQIFAVIVTGVTYAVSVKLFAPLYYSQIVPLLRDCYWAFGESLRWSQFLQSTALAIITTAPSHKPPTASSLIARSRPIHPERLSPFLLRT